MLEHFPLAEYWPDYDTALTVFRYEIVRDLCRGKRVLEIGAASGECTALFADAAREVVALDHQSLWDGSPAAGMSHVSFVRGDALSMPPEWAGRFDVVVAMEFIEHLEDPAFFQRAVFDVLSADGLFLSSTPNFDLYSDQGDGSRGPVYSKHLREYRADELTASFLDCWGNAKVWGLSQLSAPLAAADRPDDREALLCFADALYRLSLGSRYPQRRLRAAAASPCALPLRFCQSFITVLAKGALPDATSMFSALEKGAPASVSMEEAAFQSARGILQRRNTHCVQLMGALESLERAGRDKDQIIASKDQIIASMVNSRSWRLTAPLRHLLGHDSP